MKKTNILLIIAVIFLSAFSIKKSYEIKPSTAEVQRMEGYLYSLMPHQ